MAGVHSSQKTQKGYHENRYDTIVLRIETMNNSSDNISILKDYQSYLEALGYSHNRTLALAQAAKEFLKFTKQSSEKITITHLQHYHEWLQIRPKKHGTGTLSEKMISSSIRNLKPFFAYLMEKEILGINPMSVIVLPRTTAEERHPLSREEIQRLYEATDNLRERAMLHILYACGLRRTEAVMLNLPDVDYRNQLLYVREGKGAKRRVVPMTTRVARELRGYVLYERKEAPYIVNDDPETDEAKPFILNSRGRRTGGNSWYTTITMLAEKAELGRTVTPHDLRHSIATHLLESGLPLEKVRDFLGHTNLETTQIYTKISTKQLKQL